MRLRLRRNQRIRRSWLRSRVRAALIPTLVLLMGLGASEAALAKGGGNSNAQDIQELKQEIELLKQQVQSLKAAQQQNQAAPGAAAQAPTETPPAQTAQAPLPPGTVPVTVKKGKGIQIGPVNVKPGGFIEAAGIYRTKNEVSDVGSDYNTGIPFNNSPLAHENETRFSARQSRLSLLLTSDVDPETHLGAYYEMDFLSSGTNSNSRESNSYVPRIRLGYATLDEDEYGFHLLAGQEWSLLTTNTKGIMPRTEQIPLTIDAQYVEGFNWLRVPQFRVVGDFGHGLWAGVSAESPQIVTSPITAPTSGVNYTNNGDSAGLLNNSTTYSNDFIPDFVGKAALDPGYGHYELKGLFRTFTARSGGKNRSTNGWGIGGAAAMPIYAPYVDLQLSGLWGAGIGRYGSGQLPDAAFQPNLLDLAAINEWQVLGGLVTHPWAGNDLYVYGGAEHADRAGSTAIFTDPSTMKFVGAPGYGSPNLITSGCNTEGGTCQAQTNQLVQVTAGFWQDIYNGDYGRFVGGLEGGQIWRNGFSGVGGKPRTNIAIFMTSLRYYPWAGL